MKILKIMAILISIIVIFIISVPLYTRLPEFGREPSGERLERIKKSPNYKDGEFQNQSPTPMMIKNKDSSSTFKKFLFKKNGPVDTIPSTKTDLLNLDPKQDILVWFGHSSYFIQIDGKKILVDPVLSGYASPFSFMIKAFKGSDVYKPEDMPEIDYLVITHNHWDHLDYKTIKKLKPKIKNVITALGVGSNFEYWGFDKNIIHEGDWGDKIILDEKFTFNATPARHFSGRTFKRNQTLWDSFVLETPTQKIFVGGDGGYDKHFAEIGKEFGKIDLAILEDGQYNENWKYIHMMPEQVILAAKDLNAEKILPVHNSKFNLSVHQWNEPLEKITELNKEAKLNIVTPMIGEQVNIKDKNQTFKEWWKNIK